MLRFFFFLSHSGIVCVCVCVFSNSKEFDTPRSTVPCLWRCCCGPIFTASLCIVCKQCALRVFVTYLCANHFPVVTVAGVAVVVPLGAVQLGVSVDGAGFPCNCRMRKSNRALKNFFLPPPQFYYLAPIIIKKNFAVPSWQYGPVLSGGQRQRYPLISSTQVDPKAHGDDWHSLISVRGEERQLGIKARSQTENKHWAKQ